MKLKKAIVLGLISFCLIGVPFAVAQTSQTDIEELKKGAPKVYIDCEWCDINYIRTEITFVNYVRDRKEAQVHVLITTQRTGSGGDEYTLTFMGQNEFQGIDDTLKYYSHQTNTEDEIRQGLVKVLKMGLMRYVAKTPIGDRISISLMEQVKPTSVIDKWNFWVFSLSAQGFFDGQESYKYNSIYGYFSANRVTPELKIRTSLSASYYENKYIVDESTIRSALNSQSFMGLVVKSIDNHWSLGAYLSASSSTYSNLKLSMNLAPAIEYDLFPYSESTRRQLRFLYKLGFTDVRYREETICDKIKENLWNENLSVTLEVKEKWGSVSTSLEGSHYFHDFSKNRLVLDCELSIRLFKGLSFEVFGSGSRVHDQLSLSKGGASYEDILLMRKQLATTYQYFFSLGLSYTFGSIYSNVVNPRFGSAGGMMIR